MSSILDALERASRERSDLLPPQAPGNPEVAPLLERHRGLWFLLGVLLVLAALLVYGLMSEPARQDPVTQPEAPLADSPAESPSEPDAVAVPSPVPVSVPDLQSRLRDAGAPSEQSLLANAQTRAAPPPQQPSALPVEVETVPRTRVDTAPESVPAAPPRPAEQAPLAHLSPSPSPPAAASPLGVKQPAEAVALPPARVSPQPRTAEAAETAIPLVWELPQSQREALLELSISIHVYHEKPERRFVIINMRRYVEGDRLKEKGYRLERIDQDGIVLDYGAGLVRIPRS
ncbi:MAG: general secretion pathway protein GspB [Candidatus Thiodiazotropha sp.]